MPTPRTSFLWALAIAVSLAISPAQAQSVLSEQAPVADPAETPPAESAELSLPPAERCPEGAPWASCYPNPFECLRNGGPPNSCLTEEAICLIIEKKSWVDCFGAATADKIPWPDP
ncbi:MAG: hypothetical protein OXC11_12330, partial [Rhodospirillales bacterium]|nr:hypothetical protein [Rhodospirillales bacterium]